MIVRRRHACFFLAGRAAVTVDSVMLVRDRAEHIVLHKW